MSRPTAPLYTEVRNPRLAAAGHAEYEVCLLVKESTGGFAVDEMKWSVWRRYSDFDAFHRQLREKYGWQVDHIKLPPKKTFGAKTPEFMEKRRGMLQTYMREVMGVKGATEFGSHLGCAALATFINWEGRRLGMKQAAGEGAPEGGAEAPAPAPAPRARRSKRPSRRAVPRAHTAGIPSTSSVKTGVAAAPSLSKPASDLPVGGGGAAAPAPTAAAPAPAAARAPAARAPAPAPARAPAPAPASAKPAAVKDLPPPQPGRAGLLASIRKGTTLKSAK